MNSQIEMPWLSSIESNDVQLLFADLQTDIVARSKTTDPKTMIASVEVLVELARVFGLPMVISAVPEGGVEPKLLPSLAKGKGVSHVRSGASPFGDLPTVAAIRANGRKTMVIAGFATEVVVLHAVTGALEAGYRAIVVVDCCGGMSERTEAAALDQIRAAGGEVSSVVTLATAIEPDFVSERGRAMFAALQNLRLA